MSTTAIGPAVEAGRELGRLAFVEQEIGRAEAAGELPAKLGAELRARLLVRRATVYVGLMEGALQTGRWRALDALARAAARLTPDRAQFHAYAGQAALNLGREDEALAALERAVALGRRTPLLLCTLGRLYAGRGRLAEAALAYEAALGAATTPEQTSDARHGLDGIAAPARGQAAAAAGPRRPRPALADTPARLSYLRQFLDEAAGSGASTLRLRVARREQGLAGPAAPTPAPAAQPAPTPAPQAHAASAEPRPARPAAPPRPTFDWGTFWSALFSERMLRALLYLGAALLVVSAFIWMAFNWNRFAAPVQLGALGAITATLYGCGWAVRSKLGLLRSGSTLIAIGAGWVAVVGWAIANIAGLAAGQTWLLVSAICVPAYLATTLWLREEIFAALSAGALISLLLAALDMAGAGPAWQSCALVALMVGYVALASGLRALRDGARLAAPLVIIAQIVVPLAMLYASLALRGGLPLGALDRALFAGVWWLGALHYWRSLRLLGGVGYEQALAWAAPAALALSAEVAGLPRAWVGVLLLATAPIYLLAAPGRASAYAATKRPWLRNRAAWPAYSTPYLLALLALLWPAATRPALLVASLGAAALFAASARVFRQPAWAWAASAAGLLAGWHLAMLLALASATAWALAAAVGGLAYWLAGVALERAPRYALAPLAVGLALLAGATALGLALPAAGQRLIFPFGVAVAAASAGLLAAGRLAALSGAPGLRLLGPEALRLLFAAAAAALLPAWLLALAPATQPPAGLALLGAAAAYLLLGHRPRRSATAPAETPSGPLRAIRALRELLSGPAADSTQRMLWSMALALSGLALLPIAPPAALVVGALLLTWPLGLLLAGLPDRQRRLRLPWPGVGAVALDWPALGASLLALLLVRAAGGALPLGLLTPLGVAGLYLLGAALSRRASWGYLLAGALGGLWLLGLHTLGLPADLQAAWLAPAALLGVAAGLLCERRGRADMALPPYLYGYGLALVAAAGCLLGLAGFGRSELSQAAALAGLAGLAAISALRFRAEPFPMLAALLPIPAYLLLLAGAAAPGGRYGLALAGLAGAYLGLALLHAQRVPEARGPLGRALAGLGLFADALRRGFHLLSGLALALGAADLLAGRPGTFAQAGLLLAAAYALGSYVLRRPGMAAVAAPLLAAALTAGHAAYLEPLAPASGRALLWLLLAWAYTALARRLRRAPAAYTRPIFATAFGLAGLACAWALGDRYLLLAALGGLILLCLRWDRTLAAPRLRLVRGRLATDPAAEPLPIFLYPVAGLTPLWLGLLLDTLGYDTARIAVGLAGLAALWLGVAYAARGRAGAARPFLLVCYGLAALAPQLSGVPAAQLLGLLVSVEVGLYVLLSRAAGKAGGRFILTILLSPVILAAAAANLLLSGSPEARPELTAVFALAAGIFAASARLWRRPIWAAPAAFAAAPAALLALAPLTGAPGSDMLATLAIALAALGLSWLLGRRGAAAYTPPLDVVTAVAGLAAGAGAVVLTPRGAAQLGLLAGAAGLFALAARRHRDPLWLYGALAAALALYPRGLDLLDVPQLWRGPALLPGAFAAFGLGRWLERRDHAGPAGWRPAPISPASGAAWGLPAYLLAGAGAAVGVAWSLGEPRALALALAGAALLCGWAAAHWRSRPWLWLGLALGHGAYLTGLFSLEGRLTSAEASLALLAATLVLGAAGLLAEGRRALEPRPALPRLLAPSWAQGLYLFAALDAAAALCLALPPFGDPTTLLAVAWALAAALAALACLWRDGALAAAAPALLALGVDALLRLAGLGSGPRLMALGAQGIGAWWAAQGLRRLGRDSGLARLWAAPLQLWGQIANGAMLLWALELALEIRSTVPISRALAVAGLFWVGQAALERRLRLSYLGSAMLVAAWMLTALTALPAQPQAYALPAGIYLLAVGAAERWHGSPRRVPQLLELLGASVLLGVTLWQSLPDNFGYGALLGAEALLVLVWGALQRVRLLFFAGVAAFMLNLAIQSVGPIQAADKALLAFGVGLALVVAAVFVERRRDALRERARLLWSQLETWS